MKNFIFALFFLSNNLFAQVIENKEVRDSIMTKIDSLAVLEMKVDSIATPLTGYANGVYLNFDDFLSRKPNQDFKYTLKKSKMFLPKVKSSNNALIFSIVDNKKMYLNINSLEGLLDSESKKYLKYDYDKDIFIEVDITGKNFIAEYTFENSNTSMIAAQFGLIGGIAAISMMKQTYIVYLDSIKKIHVFDDKEEFLEYIEKNFPSKVGLYEKMTNPKISTYIKIKSVLEQLD
jgi:hypothetical protein